MARPLPGLLSLVFPVFNEEETLPFLRQALAAWRPTCPCPTELILVDDGSSDDTLAQLGAWAQTDPSVKVLALSTNFGQQAAMTAGLQTARGDAVALLDADLQDPLDVLAAMLTRYTEGYDVVYGQRISREGDTVFKRVTAWAFYRLMRRFVHKSLPADTGDFRLVSRRCLDVVLQLGETHRFMRGLFAWVGFPQIGVPFHRQSRQHGTTKYSPQKLLRLAWSAAVAFSIVPIKLIGLAGFGVAAFGCAHAIYALAQHWVYHTTVPGWTTLVVLFELVGGAILVALGVIGEYVGRIYEEVKRRPLFIVQHRINCD